jgi:hypothetical protein
MNRLPIKNNTQIAIALLGSSLRDRYWNPKITHDQRNFITKSVLELLEGILMEIDDVRDSILPEISQSINPPEES